MIEETAPQAESISDEENTSTAVKKPAIRRKPASRVSKTAPAAPAGEKDDEEPVTEAKETTRKTARRPRKTTTRAESAAAEAGQQPDMQPPLLGMDALERSPSSQAHVQTKVISPEKIKSIERKTKESLHPGSDSAVGTTHRAAQEASPAEVVETKSVNHESAPPPAPATAPVEHVPVSPSTVPEEPIVGPSTAEIPPSPAPRPMEPASPGGQGHGERQPFQNREGRFERGQGDARGFNRHEGRPDRFERREGRHGQQGGGGQFNRHQQGQGGNRPPQGQYDGNRPPRGDYDSNRAPQGQYEGDRRPQLDAPDGDGGVSRPVEPQFAEGIVEVSGKGFGFLREPKRSFVQTPADVFVTPEVCRKYNLRDGQWIKGEVRRSSRGPQLFRLTELNGEDPEKFRNLPNFDELTSINPKKRIRLETTPDRYTTRVMDLMTPVGKGQRGLIVAPPRTGKTTLLQHIGEAVIKNHPEMKLIILLVDERPEEVTEIRRSVPQAEIMASSNDSDLKSHTRIAQLAMERCKRLVEAGFDVFMLLDSITRMSRAFNNTATGGRTQSGGLDSRALEIPRKIFAAARNTEEAGSLTIMATALIETGSRMDESIFLEFKGTGNMELVLDRKISDQRIFPAVDIFQSGTRREELLLAEWELDKINVIRRGLAGHKPLEAIERLLSFLKKFPTNSQMLTSLPG